MNLGDLDRWTKARGLIISPWLRVFLEPLLPLFKEVLAMSLFINLLAVAVPVFVLQQQKAWGQHICSRDHER